MKMNKDYRDIFNKAKQVKLLKSEKESLKTSLESFIKTYPVRSLYEARPLFQSARLTQKLQPIMAIALLIALFVGGGTSLAAENSLPGDPLYHVKVGINEEVRGWLSLSDTSKAGWTSKLEERRLEETESLATQGKLDAKTSTDIESRLDLYARTHSALSEKIKSKEGFKSSFEVNTNLETTLRAHQQILTQISSERENAKVNIDRILAKVNAQLGVVTEERTDVEAKISGESNSDLKTAAEAKMEEAKQNVLEARNLVAAFKSSLSVNSSAKAEVKIKLAEEVIAKGNGQFNNKTYGRALVSFQKASSIAQEAKLIAKAEQKNGVEIKVPSILNFDTDTDVKTDNQNSENSDDSSDNKDSSKIDSEGSNTVDVDANVKVESDTKMNVTTPATDSAGSTGINGNGSTNVNVGL